MTNKLALACVLAMPVAVWAADTPAPEGEVRVVEMKHLTGDRLRSLVDSIRPLLTHISYDSNLNLVVLKGAPNQVATIQSLLQKVDQPEPARRPEPQVQLRIHMVIASPDSGKDGPLASEIAPAIEQMRKTFPYKSYTELDTLALQVRNQGSASMNGQLPPADPPRPDFPSMYMLNIDGVAISPEGSVSLRNLNVRSRIVAPGTNLEAGIRTDVTIQKGQKLVVGKLTSDKRDAIFLVLAADVM